MTVQVSVNVARTASTTKLLAKAPSPAFSQATHRSRCLAQLRSKQNSLEKYIYLSGLKERDPSLFYTLLYDNMRESVTLRICSATLADLLVAFYRKWSPSYILQPYAYM
jgi:malate dehydrogenase (oxaloacetate-decarboxylating)(NADP+)